jgi:phosphoribosylaminoimidazole-succinocarboxamide synthase
VVASDRVSIFNFSLGPLIPQKGEALTALTLFWLNGLLKKYPHHLVESEINPDFNFAYDLREQHPGLPLERCLVVNWYDMLPYEMIFRRHLGGSIWEEVSQHHTAAGGVVPDDLEKWANVGRVLFTPSTKSVIDTNLTRDKFFLETNNGDYEEVVGALGSWYDRVYNFLLSRGLILLDTKFEIARNGCLCDEVLTPDSSRFTTVEDLAEALDEGRDPIFYDKQFIRNWGMKVNTPFGVTGIHNLDPSSVRHARWVKGQLLPQKLITSASTLYTQTLFERIVGTTLEDFQTKYMGV